MIFCVLPGNSTDGRKDTEMSIYTFLKISSFKSESLYSNTRLMDPSATRQNRQAHASLFVECTTGGIDLRGFHSKQRLRPRLLLERACHYLWHANNEGTRVYCNLRAGVYILFVRIFYFFTLTDTISQNWNHFYFWWGEDKNRFSSSLWIITMKSQDSQEVWNKWDTSSRGWC